MSEDLKPCPFCGSKNIRFKDTRGWLETCGECEDCGALGPDGDIDDVSSAVAAWNTRTPPDSGK